jgi:hypothetical protein
MGKEKNRNNHAAGAKNEQLTTFLNITCVISNNIF